MLRALVLLALGAGAAVGAQTVLDRERPADRTGSPPFEERQPESAGDPPVVWVDGTVEALTADEVVVREGDGPAVTLNRLGGGATQFLRLRGGSWRQAESLPTGSAAGEPACVEALLDERTLLALRVFLGASCRPA